MQRNGDSTTTTTSDILTASSLHLPHIPPVANNAFRANSKDDKNAKSAWQPPLLKSSGSFHSTKITRMDSYGTNGAGISKLSITGSRSGDAGEAKVEDTKAAAAADVPKRLPNILIPNNQQVSGSNILFQTLKFSLIIFSSLRICFLPISRFCSHRTCDQAIRCRHFARLWVGQDLCQCLLWVCRMGLLVTH